MTRKWLLVGLVNLIAVVLSAAVAIGVVVAIHWLLNRAWPDAGPHSQLLFSAFAPLGVVLFAFLLAQADRLADRVPAPDGVGRRLNPA
jgi:hypothetical protein